MKTCKTCGEAKELDCFSKKLKGLQPNCKSCSAVKNKEYIENNRVKVALKRKRRYEENKTTLLQKQKDYYAKNVGKVKAYLQAWRRDNVDVIRKEYKENAEKYRSRAKLWRTNNPGARGEMDSAKRARKRRALLWADKKLMRDIYAYAQIMRQCGVNCHVDHVLPLRGKYVSGLHVPENLTVILASDNLSKSNRWVPE